MDSVIIKPSFSTFNFSSSSPRTKPLSSTHVSFLKFTPLRKLRTSSITFSSKTPKNIQDPEPKWDAFGLPSDPLLVLLPVFRSIKALAFSQTEKWVSSVQTYTDWEKAVDDGSSGKCLRSSGLGIALLSVTSNAKLKISPFVAQLAANPTFVSGLFAWLVAQSIKVVLNFFFERKWDLRILFASGGMPSSHSALCTALTTSVALCHGVADSLFPVCLGFSLIVMYDAIGVRRHAGMQAAV